MALNQCPILVLKYGIQHPTKYSNLKLSMLLSSELRGGVLTDVHAESAKYILGKWGLDLHKNQFSMKKN